jgi:hypothetical protein
VLALGIVLCIIIVVLAKKALKKIQEQELEREAQEAQAAAAAQDAEAGTAVGPQQQQRASLDAAGGSHQKQPLPLAVESKLAAKSADGSPGLHHNSTGSGSDGDLQVIVMDDNAAASGASATPSVTTEGGLIPAGQLPPAALEPEASSTSRMSSVSSLRGLLSGRFQRSS